MIVWLDGRFVPAEAAVIPIDDRGFLHGDGVFETALLYRGGFFRLRQHLERLAGSARLMRLPLPPLVEIDDVVRQVVLRNGFADANIRITLSRGAREPLLLVTARPPDEAARSRGRAGWHVITAATRRPSTAAVPAQLKALGRTYALLARIEAADRGADDALLLTDDGTICEGPTWNVFWRRGDTLFTPALDAGVLAGVTRSVLLEIAAGLGLEGREVLHRRAVLDAADEVFATMTSLGVVTIRSLDGVALTGPTRAADALQPLYWQRVATEAAADPL